MSPSIPCAIIANRSSGKQGYAIARAAQAAGAEVILISGPVHLAGAAKASGFIGVETAREMAAAVEAAIALRHFHRRRRRRRLAVEGDSDQKIKKGGEGPPLLRLIENPDILATVARRARKPPAARRRLCRGNRKALIEHARQKRTRKGCDVIVANDVSPAAGVMGGDENTMVIVDAEGETVWPKLTKEDAARAARRLAGADIARSAGE